jgi:hypothetical protein
LTHAIICGADSDGDGKVSRSELRALKKAIDEEQGDKAPVRPGTYGQLAGEDGKADFNEIANLLEGVDGADSGTPNDRLNTKEWEKAAKILGMGRDDIDYFRDKGKNAPADIADALVEEGDTNRDGKVSRDEMRALKKAIDRAQETGNLSGPLPRTLADLTGFDRAADANELAAALTRTDGSGTTATNGYIGLKEWANLAPLLSLGEDDYRTLRRRGAETAEDFGRMLLQIGDADGDGKLSQPEIQGLAAKLSQIRDENDKV